MNFKDVIVKKPWGEEAQIYANEHLGIWHLFLNYQAKTSLHSHPRKTTGLIVLSGRAKVSFLNGSHVLGPTDKVMIREGVFHQTASLSEGGLIMLEVERPNDKSDILRLEDAYGRSGKPYESEEHYLPTENPIKLEDRTVIGKCVISKININQELDQINDLAKYVFLNGCIFYKHIKVVTPGDVIDGASLRKLANKFETTELKLLEIKHA